MPAFTARDVQELRRRTGAGMLDAKSALVECGGDMEAAALWLRENGLARSAGREGRDSSEGAVAVAEAPEGSAIVELRCETDFVAKSPAYVQLVESLAAEVASKGELAVDAHQSEVEDLRISLKESIEVGRVIRFPSTDDAVIGNYLHVQSERGVNAVLVEVQGGSDDLAHDLAVHIAFARPGCISRDEVPEEEVLAERATLEQISRKEGKPEAALPKIVEGRLRGWFKERCLVDQDYVRDEKVTIAKLLGDARVTRFAQVVVGS